MLLWKGDSITDLGFHIWGDRVPDSQVIIMESEHDRVFSESDSGVDSLFRIHKFVFLLGNLRWLS